MRMPLPRCSLHLALAGCADRGPAVRREAIFDGSSLAGWSAPDPSCFHVEDGAITGETTLAHNPPRTQSIVWQGGTPGLRVFPVIQGRSGS